MSEVYSISFDNPQHRCQQFVHSLPVAQVGVQLAEDEQYIQHHSLCIRLTEVEVLRHTPIDVLLDLGAELFVLAEGGP
jgi:hypothetical protein